MFGDRDRDEIDNGQEQGSPDDKAGVTNNTQTMLNRNTRRFTFHMPAIGSKRSPSRADFLPVTDSCRHDSASGTTRSRLHSTENARRMAPDRPGRALPSSPAPLQYIIGSASRCCELRKLLESIRSALVIALSTFQPGRGTGQREIRRRTGSSHRTRTHLFQRQPSFSPRFTPQRP